VILAVAHFRNRVVLVAAGALQQMQMRPNLPVDLLPRNPVGLPYVSYELLQVPFLVYNVLSSLLAMIVNKDFALGTAKVLPLALSK
jgi:hypothetical protein